MKFTSVYQSLDYESIKPLKRYRKFLRRINDYQDDLRALSDSDLKQLFNDEFNSWKTYDPSNLKQVSFVFAVAREVTYRLLGKFQYDVQVLGALASIDRNAIQMSTGSGKTITLILSAVAFGLTHKGVYVLTVNDYLSKRDWEETHPIYDWFGLSNAYTDNDQDDQIQKQAFASDIIYCTNSTLGFAYLNSCLASGIGNDIKIIDRPLYSAIIDECDEILMDDARNPLIISEGAAPDKRQPTITANGRTLKVQDIVNKLKTLHHLEIDDEDPSAPPYIDDKALKEIQAKLNLGDDMFNNTELMHVIYSAVSAIFNNHNYTDYIVAPVPDEDTGSRIILIDKATGRLAHGRTMNDGMHAFLEMKEGVFSGTSTDSSIQITYQVLFNLFETIAGVSGTLGTSYKEFTDIYGMNLIVIPDRLPNRLTQRTRLYTTDERRNQDLIRLVNFYVASHRPILIGAKSDLSAQMISHLLTSHQIEHKLLVSTDKNEKEIVASAGKPGSIVVTTDIMGRGTDIKPEDTDFERGLVVLQLGFRPNSRVERQFAGRAARQGQPGHYERLLALPDLLEIGVSKEDREKILEVWGTNKKLIEYHHADILLGGTNPDYDEIVKLIDDSLIASESRESSRRVDDFKAYSIIDLFQVSIIRKADHLRKLLADNVANPDGTSRQEICQVLADNRYPKQIKKRKRLVKTAEKNLSTLDLQTLRMAAFDYTCQLVDKLIPAVRTASENMQETVRLAGMAQLPQQPEGIMTGLLNEYLDKHQDLILFKQKD